MHISCKTLVKNFIWFSNWSHLWRNYRLVTCWRSLVAHSSILLLSSLILSYCTFIVIFNSNYLIILSSRSIRSSLLLTLMNSIHLLISLHQIIWFERISCRRWTWLKLISCCWILHVLRDHVSVILVDGIVSVSIWVHIYFIQFMVYFWLEKLFHLLTTVLSGELLCKSEKELVLVALSPLL